MMIKVGDTVQVSDTKDNYYGCLGLVSWTDEESEVGGIVTRWIGVSLYGALQTYKFNEDQLEIIKPVSSEDQIHVKDELMIKVADIVRVVDPDDRNYNKIGTVICEDSKNGIHQECMPRFGVMIHSECRFFSYTEQQLEQITTDNDKKAKYKVGDNVVIKANGTTGIVTNDKNFRGLYYVETDNGVVYSLFEEQLSPDQSDTKGQQSHLDARYDLIPPTALKTVAEVLGEGEAKYPAIDGVPNWHYITASDHLNHALAHIYAYLSGVDTGEDDLSHAATRMLLALEIDRIGVKEK